MAPKNATKLTKLTKLSYKQAMSMRRFVKKPEPMGAIKIPIIKKEIEKPDIKKPAQKVEIKVKKMEDHEEEKENKGTTEKIRVSEAMILEDPADETEYYKKLKALFHGQKYVLMPAKRS